MNKKIVFAGGGTGGHIFPSLSLADFLCKEYEIEIFTDERGIKYLNNYKNIKIKKITSSRVFGKNIIYFIIGIVKVFLSITAIFALRSEMLIFFKSITPAPIYKLF